MGLKAQPPYPWLGQVWATFVRQAEDDRLPHAILLVGQDGVGCFDLSVSMAQYLLCVAPQNGQSCGQCKSCLLMKVDTHPDLHVISPDKKSKTQSIKIQQIRDLTAITVNTAQQGGRKLILIHPAEAMNVNAANALLKSLEEPSGDCVYILVSEQSAFLTATIRSRCSRMVVSLPSKQESLDWLNRNKVAEAERRLMDVGGRPLRVIEWLEKDLWGQQDHLRDQLQKLLTSNYSFLECSKAIMPHGPMWPLEQIQNWLIMAIPSALKLSRSGGEADSLVKLLSQQPAAKLFRLYDNVLKKKKLVLSSANPNAQLLIDEILMQMQDLGSKTD